MLKVTINNEINCFPFESISEVKQAKNKLGKSAKNFIVANINSNCCNCNRELFVLIDSISAPKKFYDREGFVDYAPVNNCYSYIIG